MNFPPLDKQRFMKVSHGADIWQDKLKPTLRVKATFPQGGEKPVQYGDVLKAQIAYRIPKPYFTDMRVLEGGFGAGTVIDVDMEVYGVKRSFRMRVTEPQKGYILEETDVDTGTVTHFIFEPKNGGCYLTIRTKMNFADGFMGFLEKLSTPAITRGIYKKELANIANYLQAQPQTA